MSNTYHHGEKAKDRANRNDRWLAQEPKWHRTMHKHKKQRGAARKSEHNVMRGEEEALFPLDRKPWIYYW